MESYRKAYALDPQNEEATFMLSAYEFQKGNTAAALKLFEELYEKNPKNNKAQYQLGALYLMNNQPQRTISLWEDLFFRGDRNPEFVFSLALAYFQSEKYDQAEPLLTHLQFFYPRDPGITFLQGEVYRKQERLMEAARVHRGILAEYPGYMNAYLGLVLTLLEQKDAAGAREVLKEASTRIADPMMLEQISTAIKNHPEAVTE